MSDRKRGNKLLSQTLMLGILYFFIGGIIEYGIITSKDYFGFYNTLSLIIGAALGFIGTCTRVSQMHHCATERERHWHCQSHRGILGPWQRPPVDGGEGRGRFG